MFVSIELVYFLICLSYCYFLTLLLLDLLYFTAWCHFIFITLVLLSYFTLFYREDQFPCSVHVDYRTESVLDTSLSGTGYHVEYPEPEFLLNPQTEDFQDVDPVTDTDPEYPTDI